MKMAPSVIASAERMIRTRSSPRCSVSVMTSSGEFIGGRSSWRRDLKIMTRLVRGAPSQHDQRSRLTGERAVDQLVLRGRRGRGLLGGASTAAGGGSAGALADRAGLSAAAAAGVDGVGLAVVRVSVVTESTDTSTA